VAVSTGQTPGRETTLALIERIAGSDLGAKLRSQVAAWHPGTTREQMDEAFQEACALANSGCRGQSEGEVYTWLRTTMGRELGHLRKRETRRAQLEVLVDVSALELRASASWHRTPEEQLIEREDEAEVERVTCAVLARLSEPQRAVAALHSRGRKRPDIAQHLGMTPRSVKRALERVLSVGRDELIRLAGHGCESGEPLVARFAFGLATPREERQAQLHLATCPRCGALYERLDLWREKVAATLPLPAVEQADPGLVERTIHGAAETISGLRRHVTETVSSTREQVADGAAQAKQHAAATYYRVVDPTPLAGVRPGAAAAAVAGCLAIGGGTTYCVQQGVDPIGALSGVVAPAHEKQKQPRPAKRENAAEKSPAPPVVSPPVEATPTPEPPAATQPIATPTPKPEPPAPTPPPAPQEEYEPVSPSGAGAASSQSSSTPARPAPAPADGPGEFDGP
jgi:DNA-directed RNA polymerase specialized sigma24 family protein